MLNSIASNNKLIRKQYINIKINDININIAKANFLPSLTSNISYKYTSDKSTTVNDISTTNKYGGLNIGLNLSYNIFSGGKRKRALQISKIDKDINNVSLEQMKQELQNSMFKTFENYTVNKNILDLSNQQVEASLLNMTLSNKKLELGAINSFNYRDVETQYINSEYLKSNNKFRLLQSWVKLLQITGGITKEINI